MRQWKSNLTKPTTEELLTVYQELFPRWKIEQLLKAANIKLYWRVLTPLIILWGFVWQRLNTDHSCDALVSHLHSGAVEDLDPDDTHAEPLSKRLHSESTSAYVQGRNRLPLSVLEGCLRYVATILGNWLQTPNPAANPGRWKGLVVRLLDGTTFRLPSQGDLVATYGQATNQHGESDWVTLRAVISFCLYTQSALAYALGTMDTSEKALVRTVMETDPDPTSLYVADCGFGVYRIFQVGRAGRHPIVARLEIKIAKALQKRNGRRSFLKPGQQCRLSWTPLASNVVEPDLPTDPIEGRLIYARQEKNGFRPQDVYLFTTLLDEQLYPAVDIVELYGHRLRVEIELRHLKTTLEMEEFQVQSAQMFRKELVAGLLAYHLICAVMVKAAQIADLRPSQLSFKRCWRRITDLLHQGVPRWVYEESGALIPWLLQRLAKCKLSHQPNKVKYEPRKVRRRPAVYPALKGDRNAARQEILNQILAVSNS